MRTSKGGVSNYARKYINDTPEQLARLDFAGTFSGCADMVAGPLMRLAHWMARHAVYGQLSLSTDKARAGYTPSLQLSVGAFNYGLLRFDEFQIFTFQSGHPGQNARQFREACRAARRCQEVLNAQTVARQAEKGGEQ